MRISIVAVGRLRDPAVRSLVDEYTARIRRYVPVSEVELADAKPPKLREAFERATSEATTIALEVTGRVQTSEAFAKALERAGSRGKGAVAFLIGGADGLPADVSANAHDRVSLSALTFPHRLARLVLVEQIYRAFTILRNEPYAH